MSGRVDCKAQVYYEEHHNKFHKMDVPVKFDYANNQKYKSISSKLRMD